MGSQVPSPGIRNPVLDQKHLEEIPFTERGTKTEWALVLDSGWRRGDTEPPEPPDGCF